VSPETDSAADAGTGALLEREGDLEALAGALEAARGGTGSTFLLQGSAGIGKSRLLGETRALATALGLKPLAARGTELERAFPFGVARQLLEREVCRAGSDPLLSGAASHAAPLLRGERVAAAGERGFALLHGLYWVTQNLAEEAPLVLLVDDLHWSDRPSLRFLLYLSQRIEELPVVVVAAARSPWEQGEGGDLMVELASAPATSVRSLRTLSEQAVERLVEEALPGAAAPFTAACADLVRGNPFLLRELIAELVERDVEPTSEVAELVARLAPETVHRSLLARLGRLPDKAAALARAAAVLAGDAHLRHAAALSGLDLDTASRAAAALVAAEFLEDTEPLVFVHPLVQSTIQSDLPAAELGAAHLRAARILLDAGTPPERVAPHLMAARKGAEQWVVDVLMAAADRASSQGAPESAAAYLRRAWEEPPTQGRRAEVLLALGRAESAAGQPGASEHLEAAVERLEAPRERASALLSLGRDLFARGDAAGAAGAFERGLRDLPEGDPLALELLANQAVASVFDPERSATAFEHLQALLRTGNGARSHSVRAALGQLAGATAFQGQDLAGAVELARQAWAGGALLEEGTSEEPAIYAATAALQFASRFEESFAILDAAVEDARRRGSLMAYATAAYCRGGGYWLAGRVGEAVADLEQVVDARRSGWDVYLPSAYGFLLLALAELERGDEAAAMLSELAPLEERWRATSVSYPRLLTGASRLHLQRGENVQALERARLAGDLVESTVGTKNPSAISWRAPAAVALARLGRRDEALGLAGEEVANARVWGAPRELGQALIALASVQGGVESLGSLREAVDVLAPSEARLIHAEALTALGDALRRAGERDQARAALREALDMAARCGALRTAARAEEELVVAGARPRRRKLSGPEALTPGELRVARMAMSGMTNREIAEALFVTTKAVQWHLGNVYRKLEIGGRAELADALR